MNSENSKIFKPHVLILNLTYKKDWTRGKKALLYQIWLFIINGKTLKAPITTTTLKYQLQHGITNLNYLTDHILY